MEEKKSEGTKKENEKAGNWKQITLTHPVNQMGKQVEILDLSGLDNLTLDDMIELYDLHEAMGGNGTVMQESSLLFAKLTAQRITGIPLEILGQLSAKDALKLKNRIYRFFYMSV